MNCITIQGTKVLEDREIRRSRNAITEGTPRQNASPRIIKYTGDSAVPEWEDAEPGRVFNFPWYFVRSAQTSKDKFETLCHVKADVSSAPYTSKLTETGQLGYKRKYDVILLVGLTELKAQIGWIDPETVRARFV